ncbi:hypothetical protein [Streptomyces sp. NPDC002463]|uniref:hypothetical protein n=1 Tax=Streptomyces sp. NPDC002463 TaxID=3364645 RepID=UPI0036762746
MTRGLAPLERIGLVTRETDARDGRVAYVALTDTGRARLTDMLATAPWSTPMRPTPAMPSPRRPSARRACARSTRARGGLVAVDGMDLTVHQGEFSGLLGTNGAGRHGSPVTR